MANAVRVLAMDAIEKAKSGHPGMPMGMADIAVALWSAHLKHSPADPTWFDRDRFVLSNGHGSMLLYALLHLSGYDLSIDDIQNFRQLHSKTPGHPEVGVTPGVETTTGPLGQGLANAVGMALAEKLLAGEFNRPGHTIVDHFTWVFAGDGCLMEGISHEACALAGVHRLSKLVVLYDDNGISIDGNVQGWYRDDVPARFQSYGWNVIDAVDGHDAWAVGEAIAQARDWGSNGRELGDGERRFAPTIIICKTVIGKGSPNRAGTAKAHGEALGADEIAATRRELGWSEPPFVIPADLYAAWDATQVGAERHARWQDAFAAYAAAYPEEAAELERRMRGVLPADWEDIMDNLVMDTVMEAQTVATRKASQLALNYLGPALPELIGGSADLTGSNLTVWKGVENLRPSPDSASDLNGGRHINYGVREFGMAALMNGLALHGGFIPYGGTFLVFSDYARNALRVAALSKLRVIHVFTHDSIGLGEDGPTHQPVETAASLRLIPNMDVWRPADSVETAIAWQAAIENEEKPTCLLLSRQNLPFIEREVVDVDLIRRGAYAVHAPRGAKAVIIATGSEVSLALAAAAQLAEEKIRVRVVSMPSTTTFDQQDVAYKRRLLPDDLPRIAVEAGVTDFWWKYRPEAVVGIDRFGESAPASVLNQHFGMTADNVADTVRQVLGL
ncbi:transketolase [Lautropia dentalis]|uniref:Transketolase n=1 Tax=Lautropia dentalis TaxID=2490857 RepID=A0A3R8MTE3_9BURK|nr:transketolase [Lautropia dentalis]RRN44715.1 transketolase [Lautropia dentalis]